MDALAAGDGAGVPDPESSYNRSATLGITGAGNTPLRTAAGQGSPFLSSQNRMVAPQATFLAPQAKLFGPERWGASKSRFFYHSNRELFK